MVGSQRHAPAALLPAMRPITHCTEDGVDHMAGLDVYGKSCPHRDSNSGPSSP
jgi:hypothetical protein